MAELTRLKKFKTIPFINIGTDAAPQWVRIGKSTIFDLALNANVVTSDFIEDEMPTDDITYYKPTLPQELQTNAGDAAFDYVYDKFYNLPTGEEVKEDVLIVFAGKTSPYKAWRSMATMILKDLNTVDEKILFDLNFGGTIDRGTATVTDGVPEFTSGNA